MAVFGPGLWIATMTCFFSGADPLRTLSWQAGMATHRKLPFGNRLLVLVLALVAAVLYWAVRARAGGKSSP
jgi:hypothetical protein